LKIATYWNEKSDFSHIKVYSDCEEVALYSNDKLIGKQKATKNEVSDKLPKPPFIFDAQHFKAGTMKAIGYIKNKAVMEYAVTTAGKASYIKLVYDKSGKSLKADGADVVFVYATVCDATGNPVSGSNAAIQFSVKGNGKLIGQNPISAEAGIATILVQASLIPGNITVEAKAEGLSPAKINITTVK
jgi:beta-galactosidase